MTDAEIERWALARVNQLQPYSRACSIIEISRTLCLALRTSLPEGEELRYAILQTIQTASFAADMIVNHTESGECGACAGLVDRTQAQLKK